MARPKKNAAQAQDTLLTLDTVPEIPVEEQPYPLPEGWKWIYLKNAYEVTSSKRIHKSDWRDSGIPFYRTRELVKLSDYGYVKNDLFIDEELYEAIKIKFGVPKVDDILISGVGTIGVPYIIKDDAKFYFKDGNIIWLKSKHIFIPKFLFYLFKSPFINKQIYDMSSGTTVDTYTIVNANKTKLPLPPLEVQQCIVDRIESLFAKLDEAREKAESALESFERRKAAILHKAFTGELTAHSHVSSKWKDKSAEELFTYVTSGSRGWAKYYAERGSIFIRMGNLSHKSIELDFSNIQYVLLPRKAEGQRTRLQKNDILISITADIGMVGLFRDDTAEAYINQHIALARPSTNENAEFIAWYLISDVGLSQLKKKQRGTTKVGLGLDDIRSIHLKMPSLPEQQEIVRILDRIFAKEQQAREAAEKVLQRIDQMKKAILAVPSGENWAKPGSRRAPAG